MDTTDLATLVADALDTLSAAMTLARWDRCAAVLALLAHLVRWGAMLM